MSHGVTIQQKYSVAGHTQMEWDSKHSTMERKLTSDIFTPRDYVTIFQAARTTPTQYCVSKITFDEIQVIWKLCDQHQPWEESWGANSTPSPSPRILSSWRDQIQVGIL